MDDEETRVEETLHNAAMIDPALGTVISTHRAKPNAVLIGLFLFFGVILGISAIALFSNGSYLGGVVCLAFAFIFVVLIWSQVSMGRDVLRIFQNGFENTHRSKSQSCLWKDIAGLTFVTGRSNTFTLSVPAGIEDTRGTLVAVKKATGELIHLNEGLRSESVILPALKAFQTAARKSQTPDQ